MTEYVTQTCIQIQIYALAVPMAHCLENCASINQVLGLNPDRTVAPRLSNPTQRQQMYTIY